MKTVKRKWDTQYSFYLILGLFFILFLIISYWSPMAGDDWAYAVNAQGQHPLLMAIERYWTWSGRFFSEFWGYAITNSKWLWDWLNPVIFTAILYLLCKNAGGKSHPIASVLLIVFLMLTVNEYLRMQTYTWMMGTTYVIPLLLLLIYVLILKDFIFNVSIAKKQWLILCILNAVIPLWMENAAAIVLGGDVLVLIYLLCKDKTKIRKMLVLTAIGGIATAIIALSPGAHQRLLLDHADFVSLSLFEKVYANLNPFIKLTFMDNAWLIRVLSVVLMVFAFVKRKENKLMQKTWWLFDIALSWGLIQTFAYNLYQMTDNKFFWAICTPESYDFRKTNLLFYGLWVIAVLVILYTLMKDKKKWISLYVFCCAGGANMAMMLSPIFDARSSIYTVYLLILLTAMVFEELKMSKQINALCITVLCTVCIYRSYEYLSLYHEVSEVTWARKEYIDWYLGDRSITEGEMPSYPQMSVHSADIDPSDEFHMYYFLRYYDLDPNLKLTFKHIDLNNFRK